MSIIKVIVRECQMAFTRIPPSYEPPERETFKSLCRLLLFLVLLPAIQITEMYSAIDGWVWRSYFRYKEWQQRGQGWEASPDFVLGMSWSERDQGNSSERK